METTRKICKEHINSWSSSRHKPLDLWAYWFLSLRKVSTLLLSIVLLGIIWGGAGRSEAHPLDKTTPLARGLIDHPVLPLVVLDPTGDERPVYHQTFKGLKLRFVVLHTKLALVVSRSAFSQALNDQAHLEKIIDQFPPDLLKIWFDDAKHWLSWLEGWDDSFMGGPPPRGSNSGRR